MNRSVVTLTIVVGLIGAIGITAMLYMARQSGPAQPVPYGGNNPSYTNDTGTVSTGTTGSNNGSVADSQTKEGAQAAFVKSWSADAGHVTLGTTVLVGTFALQVWTADPMGGEALLKYDLKTGQWSVLSQGGGLWGVAALMKYGMDKTTALSLLYGIGHLK
jgi:hypothetical protein